MFIKLLFLSRLERYADEDYQLGDTGVTVQKGMIVTIPVYAIHRDPKVYPDPEKFDPDRYYHVQLVSKIITLKFYSMLNRMFRGMNGEIKPKEKNIPFG